MVHFFFAFFCFTLSIRYMNQINFMINVPIEVHPLLSPELIANTLDTGMIHYTMGMRAFYLSVVAALWLLGPVWMFLGSLVMVLVLYSSTTAVPWIIPPPRCDIKRVIWKNNLFHRVGAQLKEIVCAIIRS